MASDSVTAARVAAVLATAPKWTAARRKKDGKPFFYIPGTTPGTVYMTAVDGCTCPAAQNSRTGDCKHQRAVRLFEAQRQQQTDGSANEADPTTVPDSVLRERAHRMYRELYPACAAGCGDLVERKGDECPACERAAEIRERQALAVVAMGV